MTIGWARTARVGITVLGLLLAVGCAPVPQTSTTPSLPASSRPTAASSADTLTLHLDALAAIADANGGTRVAGSPGDAATVAYIHTTLASLGYEVVEDPFATAVYEDGQGDRLSVSAPAQRTFEEGRDFKSMIFSAAGKAEGPIAPLGWDPDATAADGLGCTASDYAGIDDDSIVLVRPGPCYRRTIVELAQAAGASAIVTAVPWSDQDQVRRHTLVEAAGMTIPAIVATGEVGSAMAEAAASDGRAAVEATGTAVDRDVRSVFAELEGQDPDRVVMLGAHLDSSMDGPGINDNGSGVAALLAIAEELAGTRPEATIRFAFWAAEELGLRGSVRYVDSLAAVERSRLEAYLNADMLGSPNGFRGVYDEANAAPGSEEIRDLFAADLDARGLGWEAVDLGGASDHLPFQFAGVPTGGLFSGADELATAASASGAGNADGAMADACYHLACDDRSNVDLPLLRELTSSLSAVALALAGDR